jgi:hypothetical protein
MNGAQALKAAFMNEGSTALQHKLNAAAPINKVKRGGRREREEQAKMLDVDLCICVGLDRTLYIPCIYGIFGREITKYTIICGAYIRFWPTLYVCCTLHDFGCTKTDESTF